MNNFKKVLLSTAIVSLITVNAVDARACMSSGFQVGFGVNVSKKKAEIKNNKFKPVNQYLISLLNNKNTETKKAFDDRYNPSNSIEYVKKSVPISMIAVTGTSNVGNELEVNKEYEIATWGGLEVFASVRTDKYKTGDITYSDNVVSKDKTGDSYADVFRQVSKNKADYVLEMSNGQTVPQNARIDKEDFNGKEYLFIEANNGDLITGTRGLLNASALINKKVALNANEIKAKGWVEYTKFLETIGLSSFADRIKSTNNEFFSTASETHIVGNDLTNGKSSTMIAISKSNELISKYFDSETDKINSSSPAFSKANIGKEFENASHFGFDISLSAGYFWRIGDFAIYIGALGKIPVAKKVYNIKDKALADFQSNKSNSDNSNNSNKDTENTDYCFTYESKASFGGEIAGYYNLTTNFAMGLGCVVLYQRGELKYNKLNTVYSVEEKSELANLCNLLGVKLDDINSEWKKIGFDSDSKKIHNWSFTPQILALVNFGNFAIKLGAGYNFGTKLLKSDKNNMDLSLKGFEFNVGLTYTFAM